MGKKGDTYANISVPDADHEFILFKTGDTKNIRWDALKTALQQAIDTANILTLGVADPEGSVTATAPRFGVGTDGKLWWKATGSGNTGWQYVGQQSATLSELAAGSESDKFASPKRLREFAPHLRNHNGRVLAAKIYNMKVEDLELDLNGLIPAGNTKQLVWLNTGDSIGGRYLTGIFAALTRALDPTRYFQKNLSICSGPAAESGFLMLRDQAFHTDGQINEKNSTAADYGSLWSGSTVTLTTGEHLTLCEKGPRWHTGAYNDLILAKGNVVKIYYKKESGAGSLKLQLSNTAIDSGFADEVTGISADNPSVDTGILTQSVALDEYAARIVCESGTVTILGFSIYRNDVSQVLIYDTAVGSLSPIQWGTPAASAMATLMADLNPDAISWAFNDAAADQLTGVNALEGILNAAGINPTVLLLGNIGESDGQALLETAAANGWFGYSLRYATGDLATLTAEGLNGDNIHLEESLYHYVSEDILRQLFLPFEAFREQANVIYTDEGRSVAVQVPRKRTYSAYEGNQLMRLADDQHGGNYLRGFSEPLGFSEKASGLIINPQGISGGLDAHGEDTIEGIDEFWPSGGHDFTLLLDLHVVPEESQAEGLLFSWSESGHGRPSSLAGAGKAGVYLAISKSAGSVPSNTVAFKLVINPGDQLAGASFYTSYILKSGVTVADDVLLKKHWKIGIRYEYATNKITWFLDGAPVQVDYNDGGSGNVPIPWHTNSLPDVYLGNDRDDVYFLSAIYNAFSIFSGSLTDAEIVKFSREPELSINHADCKCNYLFNERAGNRILDRSSQNNHAQVNGIYWRWRTALQAALSRSASASLDFGSIGAASSATLTLTVSGAKVGDSVVLQPNRIGLVTLHGEVTSEDTVTVTAVNPSAGAIDPAATTIRATLIKH